MAEHTKRPLNELERRFAEEHHNLIYRYMRLHRLDPEEWYDILIIPYLNAVKKYHQYERFHNLEFEQVFFRTLDNARSNYFRDMDRLKRKPSGGVYSYDDLIADDEKNNSFEIFLIDKYTNVEKQAVLNELFREFYTKCVEYDEFQKELRKIELDMLLSGYDTSDIVDVVMRRFGGCGDKDMHDRAFYHDRERFRKIFKDVFGF